MTSSLLAMMRSISSLNTVVRWNFRATSRKKKTGTYVLLVAFLLTKGALRLVPLPSLIVKEPHSAHVLCLPERVEVVSVATM